MSQPFVRNTAFNLYGQVEFDHKLLKDDIEVAFVDTNRHANVWVGTLAGDQRDSTGITNFNISGSYGKITYTLDLAACANWKLATAPGDESRELRASIP